MERKDLYKIIKENKWEKPIKHLFGRPYTSVSTKDLETCVREFQKSEKPKNKFDIEADIELIFDILKSLLTKLQTRRILLEEEIITIIKGE